MSADPNGKNGTVSYAYDNVGNRQQMNSTLGAVPAGVFFYNNNDQLTTDTYDANGNTTASAGIASTYDFENHMVQKGAVTIVYDGDGNRVAETVAGVTTKYLVDTQNPTGYAQVVDELQNGAVTRTYSWGLELISKLETANSTRSSYGYDGHGSVRFLTSSAGTITDTYDYDAFGNLTNQTGTTPNNYLFAGEQFDPALNLYYNRAQYLNTSTGRFWSMDTDEGDSTEPLSLNRYLYTSSNPVNMVDPSGNEGELAETIGTLPAAQTIATIGIFTAATACVAASLIQHGPGFCGSKNQPLTLYRGLSSKGKAQWKPEYFSGDGLSLYETLYSGNYRFRLPFEIDYLEPKTEGTKASHIYLPPFLGEIGDITYTPQFEDPAVGQGHWSLQLSPWIALTADILDLFYDFAQQAAQKF